MDSKKKWRLEPKRKPVWWRVGMIVELSPNELNRIRNGEPTPLQERIRAGKFQLSGDTYAPWELGCNEELGMEISTDLWEDLNYV